MKVEVYTDGSATVKDLPGGCGVVVLVNGELYKELSIHLEKATNNDAELLSAIKGLEFVAYDVVIRTALMAESSSVTLISDSQIILNWANGSYRFKQVEKIDLYNTLRELVTTLNVKTQWVRGHSGDRWNERCDQLANNARKGIGLDPLDKSPEMIDTRIGSKKNGIVSLWYGDVLKIVDLENNIVEDYNRDVHGKRGSALEIRGETSR